MNDSTLTPPWYRLTPDRLILGLLVVECLLWLSERIQCFHKGYAVLTAAASVAVVFVVMLLWLVASLFFRWQFQFSIRSLLVLTIAVAIPCSWLAVEMKAAREQKDAVEEFEFVEYAWQVAAKGVSLHNAQPPGPEWLRKLLGDDFFQVVVWLDGHSDTITDAELARLARLTQLEGLSLDSTPITDAELAQCAGLRQLQRLSLRYTPITDKGVKTLVRLPRLTKIDLRDTEVTDEAVKKLQQALPHCTITH